MPAHNRPTQKTLTEKHAVELSRNNRTTQPEPHKPQPRTRPEQPTKKQATRIPTSHHRETVTRASLVDLPSGSKPLSGSSGGTGGAPHGDSPSTACSLVTADRRLDYCRPGPIRSQNRILSASEGRTGVKPPRRERWGPFPTALFRCQPPCGSSKNTTPVDLDAQIGWPCGDGTARRSGRRRRSCPFSSDRTGPIGRTRAPRRRLGRGPSVLGRNRTVPHEERPRRHPAGPEGNRGSGRPRERRSTNGQRPRSPSERSGRGPGPRRARPLPGNTRRARDERARPRRNGPRRRG